MPELVAALCEHFLLFLSNVMLSRGCPILYAAVLLGMLFLSGCSKQGSPEKASVAPYFPNTVGDEWVYSTYDSLYQRPSNVITVRVAGSTTLSTGLPVKVWLYSQTGRVDTEYVAVRNDTVLVYPHRQVGLYYEREVRYVLPWHVGAAWGSPLFSDYTNVISLGTETTPAGSFAQTYFQFRNAGCCNRYVRVRSWVAPRVGLVRRGRFEINLGMMRERSSWTLVSYHVSAP